MQKIFDWLAFMVYLIFDSLIDMTQQISGTLYNVHVY